MPVWMPDLVKDLAGVVLGWALGVGTAVLTDWRRERKKLVAVRRAISIELRETAQRLVLVMYRVRARQGRLDRPFLEWMRPQIERYAGPNPRDGMLSAVRSLLERTDDDAIAILAAEENARAQLSFWPEEHAPYTETTIAQAHDFDPEYAVRVLDVLAHLRMFNGVRENGLHYFRLTFESGLTPENHASAVSNVAGAEDQMALRAEAIIRKITELEARSSPDLCVGTNGAVNRGRGEGSSR
jgi:hypothetical protein